MKYYLFILTVSAFRCHLQGIHSVETLVKLAQD
jgi:hypothetical protein